MSALHNKGKNDKTSDIALKILACQLDIPGTTTIDSRNQHLKCAAGKAHAWLQTHPADILLLPELSSLDYSNKTFSELDTLAENDDGQSFETWSTIARAHKCWVLYGYARRRPDGYSIATGILNPNGELKGVYEKLHLAQFGASEEKDYFNIAGTELVVFNCKGFTLAPIICYDIRFAELARTLALQHDVDCILHTGAYARDPSFDSWHDFVKTRAMENQIYVVSLNRAGSYFGNSVMMPPWVDEQKRPVEFSQHDEQCQLLEIRKSEISYARDAFHFLDDRLPSYSIPAVTI